MQDLNFDGDEFALVDTLFSLAEAYLYCQLVELKVGQGGTAGVAQGGNVCRGGTCEE